MEKDVDNLVKSAYRIVGIHNPDKWHKNDAEARRHRGMRDVINRAIGLGRRLHLEETTKTQQ